MRIILRLDLEVAAAAEQLRRERQISVGEAVNELARAGLARGQKSGCFQQRTADLGFAIGVTDITDALELLDQYDAESAR